jgi:hypothetical protein
MNHIENNKILFELQHGFRHNRSCETQLLSFIQELSETDNKKPGVDMVSGGMFGCLLVPLSGIGSSDSDVKTD